MEEKTTSRRHFLGGAALLMQGAFATTALGNVLNTAQEQDSPEEDISPTEDLMREHGVLKRVLLVYQEIEQRLAAGKDFSPDSLRDAATIIKTFIEEYHEKMEEDYLFPRFIKAGKLADLVKVLTLQHERGRILTGRIINASSAALLKQTDTRTAVTKDIRDFVRMYNPHEAREDTVLFPALRSIVSAHEFGALGEDFDKKEHAMFGEDGFEQYVAKVEVIEKSLGIDNLARFTPTI